MLHTRHLPAHRFAGLLFLLALGCSGGGGPSAPSDRTPPPAPQLSLIRIEVPADGRTTVRGEAGAVEAQATVLVTNAAAAERGASPASAEARAGQDGAFTLQVAAENGDELEILVRDDAGNRSNAVHVPAGPDLSTFRVTPVAGSGQSGVVGRPLTDPFRVRVRGGSPPVDLSGVDVGFEVVSGGGTLSRPVARTGADGVADALLTLSSAQGPARVRATVEGVSQEVLFDVEATGAPELVTVTPGEADRGTDVTIAGRNFSPVAVHNLVEFNGVSGEVRSAQPDRLTVRVPAFGSDGPLTVTLTGVRSNALSFRIRGQAPALPGVGSAATTLLAPGQGGLVADVRLGFLTGSEEYVLAVQSLSPSPGSSFRHGLAGDAVTAPEPGTPSVTGGSAPLSAQERLDALLRAREADVAEQVRGKARPPAGIRLGGAEAQVGDEAEFFVINTQNQNASLSDPGNFDRVRSSLRYKGPHTLVYVDQRVPATDLNDTDVRAVGDRFENQTYGVDRGAFGSESDIDDDGRITILLTPTVNALNQGSNPQDGIIIGFFFGLDLLPSFFPSTSNAREIFYGFVPDPSGRFGPPIPRDFALSTLNELFAHEFQHMISFNEHVLVRDGQSEDLWLNEGLSSVAEDLNGFDGGNHGRMAFYLANPAAAGLAVANGPDGLAQRGAAFIFLRWLGDQLGEDAYRSLVQTNATGRANVELATGRGFDDLFGEWFPALFLDDAGLGTDARFQIPSLALREIYEHVRQLNPELGFGPYLALQTLSVPGGNASANAVGTAGTFTTVRTAAGTNERVVRVTAPTSSQTQVTVIRSR